MSIILSGDHHDIRGEDLASLLNNVERHVISSVLKHHHGNKTKAALQLGISRQGLYYKLSARKIPVKAATRNRRKF